MAKIPNLPSELLGEILSRVPVQSMKEVRLTCKTWNTLTKGRCFPKKHLAQAKAAREIMAVTVLDSKVCLMSINLHKEEDVKSSIKCKGKVIKVIDVHHVYHCGGFIAMHHKRLDYVACGLESVFWGKLVGCVLKVVVVTTNGSRMCTLLDTRREIRAAATKFWILLIMSLMVSVLSTKSLSWIAKVHGGFLISIPNAKNAFVEEVSLWKEILIGMLIHKERWVNL